MGRERYTVGDYVLVQGTKTELICQLTGFSKNTTDGQATAGINWLYWPQEMTRQLRSIPSKKRPRLPDHTPREVFLSDSKDTISVVTILSKVSVLPLPQFKPLPPQSSKIARRQYYTRWYWNSSTRKFNPASEMNGLLGAVMSASSPNPSLYSSPSHRLTPAHKSTPPSPHIVSSRGKKMSINLTRSKNISSPSEKRKVVAPPKSTQPLSLTPESSCLSRAASTAKSCPQKTISTPEQLRTNPQSAKRPRMSRNQSDKLVDILTYGGGLVDELPLPPPNSMRKQERGRSREKQKVEREVKTTPKRLNARDVMDLLGEEEEEEEEEEEADEVEEYEDDYLNSNNQPGVADMVEKRKRVRQKSAPGHTAHETSEKESCESENCEENVSKFERRAGAKEKRSKFTKTGGKGSGSGGRETKGIEEEEEKIAEDILPTLPIISPDILTTTTPTQKKLALRERSGVKPPAYLASVIGSGCEPTRRKRDRSPTRLLDILISEPETKKMKNTTTPIHATAAVEMEAAGSSRPQNLQNCRQRGEEGRDDRGVGCQRETLQKTPGNKLHPTTARPPGTLPRDRSSATSTPLEDFSAVAPTSDNHLEKPEADGKQRGVNKKQSERTRSRKALVSKKSSKDAGGSHQQQKKERISSTKPLARRRRVLRAIDWDSISGESELSDSSDNEDEDEEYEMGSEEGGSESEASSMEEGEEEEEVEEEEEEEEPIIPPRSSQKIIKSDVLGSVTNWSPEMMSTNSQKTPGASSSRKRQKKTTPLQIPHQQTISKTPSHRTPAGSRATGKTTTSRRANGRTPAARSSTRKTPAGRVSQGKTPTGRTPRVVPTPNIPQRKKTSGRAARSDFDKVRQRYDV